MRHLAGILAIMLIFSVSCGGSKYANMSCGFSTDDNPNHDAPMTVKFRGTAEGDVKSWDWSFSDGGKATGMEPEHVFEKEGEYSATLKITCIDDYSVSMTMVGITVKNGLRSFRSGDFHVDVLDKGESYEFSVSGYTNGWVGIAFPREPEKLTGANLVMGYVKDGAPDVADMHFTSETDFGRDDEAGGKNDVTPVDGSEFFSPNKATDITFDIPKVTDDKFDIPLKPGKMNVWLGIGPDNGKNFTSKPVTSGWLEIDLP